MPYCDSCERHWTPTSMRPDGTCPTCGSELAPAKPLRPAVTPPRPPEEGEDAGRSAGKAPWHFKLLLLVLVVYLSWRAVQGFEWVAHHL